MRNLIGISSSLYRSSVFSRIFPRVSFSTANEGPLLLCSDAENGVRTLTLNQPKKRNPLSEAMIAALTEHLTDLPSSVSAVVINASGPAFSAGHNLRELSKEEPQTRHNRILDNCARLMLTVADCPVPVIASVHGAAAAAGCQLVATCDLAVATESAKFSLPGVHLGIFCTTPGVAVARSLNSRKRLAELIFTGDPISASDARDLGLVGSVVPEAELQQATQELAARIARHSRSVIRLGKKALKEQLRHGEDLEAAYVSATAHMAENFRMEEAQRGISAFLAKSKPEWTHSDEKYDE